MDPPCVCSPAPPPAPPSPRAPPAGCGTSPSLPCWLQGVLRAGDLHSSSPYTPPLLLPPLPPPLPPGGCSSSRPLTICTLCRAGWRCSALEFMRWSAVEDAIFTASVFFLVRGFLKHDTTWMLKCVMSPWLSGWKRARCLENAFVSFLCSTFFSWSMHLWYPENALSPKYSVCVCCVCVCSVSSVSSSTALQSLQTPL